MSPPCIVCLLKASLFSQIEFAKLFNFFQTQLDKKDYRAEFLLCSIKIILPIPVHLHKQVPSHLRTSHYLYFL